MTLTREEKRVRLIRRDGSIWLKDLAESLLCVNERLQDKNKPLIERVDYFKNDDIEWILEEIEETAEFLRTLKTR